MKNSMLDVQNHLMAQLERLGDDDLTSEKNTERLKGELRRSHEMSRVATVMIDNAALTVRVQKMFDEGKLESKPSLFLSSEEKLNGIEDKGS